MRRLSLFCVLTLFACFLNAQMSMKWIAGNFDGLKTETAVKIAFQYDSLSIDKYHTEDEYIDAQKREEEGDKKGIGEIWEQQWRENKSQRCEHKFKELFQKYAEMNLAEEKTRYTLVFNLTRFITKNSASWINGELWLIDNHFPQMAPAKLAFSRVPAECVFGKCPVNERLAQAYAKVGKSIGQYVGRIRTGGSE